MGSFFIFLHSVKAQEVDLVKIGVYEYEPYCMVNEEGEMEGYYYDLMKLFEDELSFDYEFIVLPLSDGMNQLVSGDLDLMLGISMNNQFKDQFIFNRNWTNKEIFGLFSLEEVSLNQLKERKDLKLGLVRGDSNANKVLEILKANQIEVTVYYEKDYHTLVKKLEEKEIDLYVDNLIKASDYYLVYEFNGQDVYIAGNENSELIIEEIDRVIEEFMKQGEYPITLLLEEYFGDSIEGDDYWIEIIVGFALFTPLLVIYPSLKRKFMRNQIKKDLMARRYFLEYQPIYHPKTNQIIGFESLLRLRGKNQQMISPMKMISKIEKYGMSSYVSFWVIDQVIKDYHMLKTCRCVREQPFYISVNCLFHDIENQQFVKGVIKKLNQSNLGMNKICLELVERLKLDDLETIMNHIQLLKQAGFIISMDEFGKEYANLDLLHQLDVDIIKIDKLFIEGIGINPLKEEVVLLISKLALIKNQSVILDGVEHSVQLQIISQIKNEKLYVQGDYYNKPLSIEQIFDL